MKIHYKKATTLALWLGLIFCFQAEAKQSTAYSVPSWLEVKFSADDVYNKKTKRVKDDVVGYLVADGAPVNQLHWYKPLFGNQNLLFFNASAGYVDKLVSQIVKIMPLSVPPWSVSMGEVKPEKVTWKRLRYGPIAQEFSIDMYWCDQGKEKNQLVVYWGSDAKQFAPALKQLMTDLSTGCKGK